LAALGRAQRIAAAHAEDPEQRVARVVADHGRTLLRVAHQWSLCHDDALDAFQRGLEIFFRRLDRVDPATEVAWLKVVIRNEALAIRRGRSDSVAREDVELDTFVPAPQRAVEEQIVSGERVRHSAEALRALKPDEARALMLKAEGLSYDEIADVLSTTRAAVKSLLFRAREEFRQRYARAPRQPGRAMEYPE
jgi:RNA polymerase sigma factor (sigma-70 family)